MSGQEVAILVNACYRKRLNKISMNIHVSISQILDNGIDGSQIRACKEVQLITQIIADFVLNIHTKAISCH